MQTLMIRSNQNAQPAAYEPKLNFKFYRQTRDDKNLKSDGQDGFSALVDGLLNENVDMIISTYYHALAWYKSNQPSEDAVEEALASTIFVSDEATDKAFDDILNALKADGFLARKLSEFVKNQDKNADILQTRIEGMEDGDRREQLSIGLEEIKKENDKLKSLLASNESSPKPDGADSTPQN